jgi:HTH-type transcriptional regulator/antitoxin HigA
MASDLIAYRPDYAVPPGETLRDTLDALDMSQADLARRTGLSAKHINQIVQGVAALSPETALALEHVTGVPARLWNALEANYRQREARLKHATPSAEDLQWLNSLPIKALVERGALPGEVDAAGRLESVLAFFGVANRGAWESVWVSPDAVFRRSKVFAIDPIATAAWLRLGEVEAARIRTAAFDRTGFRLALDEVRAMMHKHPAHSLVETQRVCSEAGVAFVVVPEIPGSRANGATRWLSSTKALIELSLRHSWEDTFWFSFFHEAAHVLLHGKREGFVDDLDTDDQLEREADAFAGGLLIPTRYDGELRTIVTLAEVQAFARKIRVPPGIIVGRLQRDRRLGRDVGNRLRHRLWVDSTGAIKRV